MPTIEYIISNLKWYLLGAIIIFLPPFILHLRYKKSQKKGVIIFILGWFIPIIITVILGFMNVYEIFNDDYGNQISKIPIISIIFFIVGMVKGGKKKDKPPRMLKNKL
jgi:Na+/proline symporter